MSEGMALRNNESHQSQKIRVMKKLIRLTVTILLFISIMEDLSSQNAGEIIFSSAAINAKQPGNLKNTFIAGENIYAVAYLPQTVKELYPNATTGEKLQVEIFIYERKAPMYEYQQPMDMQLTFANMYVTGSIKDNKYLVIDLVPDPSATTAYGNPEIIYNKFGRKYEGPVGIAEALAQLTPGEHKMKMVVNCYYSAVAQGEFTIKGNDFGIYATKATQINDAAFNAGVASAAFPVAVISDSEREALMVAALKSSNDWKTGRIDGTEVLRTAITYDWEIRRHEISGAILHRYCIAAMAVKTKSGGCAYYKITFQEDFAGGDFLPLRYDGAGDKVVIDCNSLKR